MKAVRRSLALAAIAFLSSVVARADVWLIDARGQGDFTEIQEGIDASHGGDVLLVAPGHYAGFTVPGIEVAVVALANGVVVEGTVRVEGTEIGELVHVCGLRASQLEVLAALGPVRIVDCAVLGVGTTYGGGNAVLLDGDSRDVVFVGGRVRGRTGYPDFGGGYGTADDGDTGLRAHDSRAALYGTIVGGGVGGYGSDFDYCFPCACSFGGDGAPGLDLHSGSSLFLLDARVAGGGGGDGGECPCYACWDGVNGPAVRADPSSEVLERAVRWAGDREAPTVPLAGAAAELLAPPFGAQAGALRVVVRGRAGARATLLVSSKTRFRRDPRLGGILHVGPLLASIDLGELDDGGTLLAEVPLPSLPPGENLALHLQALFSFHGIGKGLSVPFALSDPRVVQVLPDGAVADRDGNGRADDWEIAQRQVEDCNGNGVPDPIDILDGTSSDLDGNGLPDECEITLRVDRDNVSGNEDGLTWATAYADLQVALAAAAGSASPYPSLWIAEGEYRPGPLGAPSARFEPPDGARLFGGFQGNETSLDQRDPALHVTRLSADLAGNDVGFTKRADNSLQLVGYVDCGPVTRLDGIELYGSRHGAVVIDGGTAQIVGCRFFQDFNGLVCELSSSLLVERTVFEDNARRGLEIEQADGSPPIEVSVMSSRFLGGHSGSSAALSIGTFDAQMTVADCLFHDNPKFAVLAEPDSYSPNSTLRLVGNTIVNGTLVAQEALGAHISPGPTWVEVSSSILYGSAFYNGYPELSNLRAATLGACLPYVDHCCIEGLSMWTGNGNLGSAPQFRDPDGADGQQGTLDDDYRLQYTSPCVDSGSNSSLPSDAADLDSDSNRVELLPLDLDGEPRRQDVPGAPDSGEGDRPILDRGAYESS